MGDDRRGRASRPGRGPRQRPSSSDRRRPANDLPPSEPPLPPELDPQRPGGPVTVHDLMERVGEERSGRRRPPNQTSPQTRQRPDPRPVPPPDLPPDPAPWQMPGTPDGGPSEDDLVTDVFHPMTGDPAQASGWPTAGVAPDRPPRATNSRTPAPVSPGKRRMRMVGRVSSSFLAVVALVVTGGAWSYLNATGASFTQVSALDSNNKDVIDPGAQLGDENYLIAGTDTRAGANGKMGAGTESDAEGARSDTVMLVNIPKSRSRVVAVSFPRDLDISRPQCARWNNGAATYSKETYPKANGEKLNSTYAIGGPKCLVSTIQQLTGSSINHFIGIDFSGFDTMVNEIGGVEVCATKPMKDEILGTIIAQPGRQRLNGAQALNYVRARHVYGEERSDYDRISRQQKFLASLLRGAMSGKMLLDPVKMNGFIHAFTSTTFVDKVTPNDLVMLGKSLQDLNTGAVTFLTIPTAGTTSYGNEIPRESDIKAIFKAIRDDQPLPGEKKSTPAPGTPPPPPAPTPQYTAVDPSTVSVKVSNGSGKSGQANTVASRLGNVGFQIYNTGNYAQGVSPQTQIHFAKGHEDAAATVASAIPGAVLTPDDGMDDGSIVQVVIGTDYLGKIVNPTSVGQPITNTKTADAKTPVALPSDLEHVNAADDSCK